MIRRSYTRQLAFICLSIALLGTTAGCAKRAVSSAGEQQAAAAAKAGPVETIVPDKIVTFPDHQPTPPNAGGGSSIAASRPEQPSATLDARRPPLSDPQAVGGAASDVEPVLTDIFFELDRYTINADARSVLDTNAQVISNLSDKSVVIEGHCDERGTQAYNLVLGEKRAKSTKHYLEDLGVPAARLKIVSYGEVRPLCHQHEERCWQKNRRAHFTIR